MRRVADADMGRYHVPSTTHVSEALWMFQPIQERGRIWENRSRRAKLNMWGSTLTTNRSEKC